MRAALALGALWAGSIMVAGVLVWQVLGFIRDAAAVVMGLL